MAALPCVLECLFLDASVPGSDVKSCGRRKRCVVHDLKARGLALRARTLVLGWKERGLAGTSRGAPLRAGLARGAAGGSRRSSTACSGEGTSSYTTCGRYGAPCPRQGCASSAIEAASDPGCRVP